MRASSRLVSFAAVMTVVVAVAGSGIGCRDFTDAEGHRLSDFHIVAGRSPPGSARILTATEVAERHFVVDSSELEPLRDRLGDSIDGRLNIFGNLSVFAAGDVTLFDPAITDPASPTLGVLADPRPFTFSAPFKALPVRAIRTEYQALCGDPFLGLVFRRFTTGGGNPCDPIPIPRRLSDALEGLTFHLRRGAIDLRWAAPEPGVDPSIVVPTLALTLPFTVELNQTEATGPFIDLDWSNYEIELRLQLEPCGAQPGCGFAGTCRSDGPEPFFDAYRGAGDAGDLRFPEMGMEPTIVGRVLRSDGDADCTVLGLLVPLACAFAEIRARENLHEAEDRVARRIGQFVHRMANPSRLQAGGIDFGTATATVVMPGGMVNVVPFGAPGGTATDNTIASLANGANLTGLALPPPAPTSIRFPPSLQIALFADANGNFASEARTIFAAPLLDAASHSAAPRGARGRTHARYVGYVGSFADPEDPSVRFDFMLDFDGDAVDDALDLCPTLADCAQQNDDGDAFGDACDLCRGQPNLTNEDRDHDRLGNECDCDRDADECPDNPSLAGGFGADPAAACPVIDYLDDHPSFANPQVCHFDAGGRVCVPQDLDGDDLIDDCDPDDDGDGVPDFGGGSGVSTRPCRPGEGAADACDDNCPHAANADQADFDLDGRGDACDPGCRGPGDRFCGGGGGSGRFFAGAPMEPVPGVEPAESCLRDGLGHCVGIAALDPWCLWDDRCAGARQPDILRLYDAEQRLAAIASSATLGAPPGIGPGLAEVIDLDGDGVDDVAVGSPGFTPCFAPVSARPGRRSPAPVCLDRAGEVILVSSRTGDVIDRVSPGGAGAEAGAALLRIAGTLLIGAPAAANPNGAKSGAVFAYDLTRGAFERVYYGSQEGERFGASLVSAGDLDGDGVPELLSGAPGARTAAGPGAGRVVALRLDGARLATFDGPVAGGGLGADSTTLLPRQQTPAGLLAGAPGAFGGAGLVAFFHADGTLSWAIAGGAGERLGVSVAAATDFDGDGIEEIAVGAPGAGDGAGVVRIFTPFGTVADELPSLMGLGFGRFVSSAGDLDGDGRQDLLVGVADIRGDGAGATYPGAFFTYLGAGGQKPPKDTIPPPGP